MRKIGDFILWIVIFLVGFNIITGSFYFFNVKNADFDKVTSPIPELLKKQFNSQVQASYFWKPNIVEEEKSFGLSLTAKAAISYDLTDNTLLYGKNINGPLPMASITKIMTAVLTLENKNLDDKIDISPEAATIGENSMGLSKGEVLRVEDLLYGLLLPSGNDAAESLAEGSDVGRDGFVYLMNKKAEDIGLVSTRFSNPSGLEGDGLQYSTAKELMMLTRYALQNPTFAKIVSTYEYYIPATPLNKEYLLFNETNLLTSYPGVKGVKTGYTDEAGLCLVSYLEQNGHRIIAVILNSQNRRSEMKELLSYSLRQLGEKPPIQY